MNERVLELLKAPKNIQSEDLGLLKQEIDSYPYIQNIRALYLYGVYRYDQGNYQKVLSTTAAYTTDKKILYQLINGKIRQKPKPETTVPANVPEQAIIGTETQDTARKPNISGFPLAREEAAAAIQEKSDKQPEEKSNGSDQEERLSPLPRTESKPVYANGELNRILFEGEEDFLADQDVETIDLESTLESGSIVTQKPHKEAQTAVTGNDLPQEKDKDPGLAGTDHRADQAISETEGKDGLLPAAGNVPSGGNAYNPGIAEETESLPVPEEPAEQEGNAGDSRKAGIDEEPQSGTAEIENSAVAEESTDYKESTPNPDAESAEKEEKEALPAAGENVRAEDVQQVSRSAETDSVGDFTSETLIKEGKTGSGDTEKMPGDAELSFHETESFMPHTSVEAAEDPEQQIREENIADRSVDAGEQAALFTPEKIISEDGISGEKETLHDESQLSFHGTESFLPEVNIQAPVQEERPDEPIQPNINKHEEEMRRLIEEVEKKMKERAAAEKTDKQPQPETADSNINFAETRPDDTSSAHEPQKTESSSETPSEEISGQNEADVEEPEAVKDQPDTEAARSAWRPMNFQSNLPDSLLNQPAPSILPETELKTGTEKTSGREFPEDKKEAVTEEEQPLETLTGETRDTVEKQDQPESSDTISPAEEAPVMNVSFFGSGWTIAQPETPEEKSRPADQDVPAEQEQVAEKLEAVSAAATQPLDSNVPGFINTWQSWLKIDRTEEIQKEKTETKAKVIEAFIENNPKISQLKDESTFVVKEKGDDISHLMTETLANLYFEQKLYTKAIKAFEILIKKSPDKEEYFKGKIQEIKDFRTK
ncbi:hypothetical protein [uncultured Chryseobacterium sp.]|uniref:hypothetical protein n=1 Tax=uncultured Chryseobacterium sp. TaxID=259322 RepID=UPI0025CDFE56|nr:hypothetical protein [uncultured Chryseobacterium sp.]